MLTPMTLVPNTKVKIWIEPKSVQDTDRAETMATPIENSVSARGTADL